MGTRKPFPDFIFFPDASYEAIPRVATLSAVLCTPSDIQVSIGGDSLLSPDAFADASECSEGESRIRGFDLYAVVASVSLYAHAWPIIPLRYTRVTIPRFPLLLAGARRCLSWPSSLPYFGMWLR